MLDDKIGSTARRLTSADLELRREALHRKITAHIRDISARGLVPSGCAFDGAATCLDDVAVAVEVARRNLERALTQLGVVS